MRRARLVILLAASVLVPAALDAQEREAFCRDLQGRTVTVGQWASYAFKGGKSDGFTIRYAIVDEETVEGARYYWYEMATSDPKKGDKGKTIVQMLVPGIGYDVSGVRAMVMQTGDSKPTRMPDPVVRMMGGRVGKSIAAEATRSCLEAEVVGWETVTVPGGAHRALHIRQKDGSEAWITRELFFGLIRSVTKDGVEIVLTGNGADAASAIAQRPR